MTPKGKQVFGVIVLSVLAALSALWVYWTAEHGNMYYLLVLIVWSVSMLVKFVWRIDGIIINRIAKAWANRHNPRSNNHSGK
jgi:hypothetical protein